MKNIFNYIALATVAAVALVSCTKEQPAPEESSTPAMKTITITTDVRTKTTLDATHENLGWSTGDQISVFNNIDTDNAQLTYAPGDYMTVTVPAGTSEVYGHYPYYSGNTSGPSAVSIYISKNQTQENPGELNGYYYPMVAKGDVIGDKANMVFYPVASALALNIYNTDLAGTEKVSRIVVTPTANTLFTGSQNTNITADGVTYTSAASSDPITVTLTNALTLGSAKPADSQTFDGQIYVCLAKQSYASVHFEISTTKGVYTITSNSTPFDCANHDFIPVNIDLAAASFTPVLSEPTAKTGWYRVEGASWLATGDRVAIVANESNFALSTTQNANNRGNVAVSKEMDGDYTKLSSAPSTLQEFILEEGNQTETFAFWQDNGANANKYICFPTGGNYLRSQADIDDKASFSVSLAGTAAIINNVQNTSYNVKCNYNSGNPIFSCYASAQTPIAIYKYYGGSTPTCDTPTISLTGATVTISSTAGATIYYTTDGSTPTDASTKYTVPFDIAATVTVKAIAIRDHYNNSAVASQECVYSGGGSTPSPETITFSTLGLTNGEQYSDPFNGGHFTITFAGGGNDGKYYDTGSGIRTYGGGTITIASSHNIASIVFTWDGSNKPDSDVASPTGYSTATSTWTGSAKSIVLTRPSGSGHWRLQSVTVTYE